MKLSFLKKVRNAMIIFINTPIKQHYIEEYRHFPPDNKAWNCWQKATTVTRPLPGKNVGFKGRVHTWTEVDRQVSYLPGFLREIGTYCQHSSVLLFCSTTEIWVIVKSRISGYIGINPTCILNILEKSRLRKK